MESYHNYKKILIAIYMVRRRRCPRHENDISAKEKIPCKGSWIQSKNEYSRRKKSISCQKSKRKKTVISIGRMNVAFSSM